MTKGKKPHGHGAVMFNLRLQRTGGGRVTRRDLDDAMERLVDSGKPPKGWKIAAIEWAHPKRGASPEWRRGQAADIDRFLPLMRDIGVKNLRAAEVERPTRQPTKKQAARMWRLKKKQLSAQAKRAKSLRALDRSKTAKTRAKHRKAADYWRKVAQAEGRRHDAIAEKFAGLGEFEVAVDYKRRGRR